MRHLIITLLILSSWLCSRGDRIYRNLGQLDNGVAITDTIAGKSATIEVRAAPKKAKPGNGKSKTAWGLVFGADSLGTYEAILQSFTQDFATDYEKRHTIFTILHGDSVATERICSKEFTPDGINTLIADIKGGRATFRSGDEIIAEIPFTSRILAGVHAYGGAKIDLFMVDDDQDDATFPEVVDLTNKKITFWEYLDRENDPSYARLGGRYRIATVDSGNGCFEIVYISGAEVCASKWYEGMYKGRLKPSPAGGYDLIWVDSTGRVISNDANADIVDDILTLSFPLYKTTIRFTKTRA